MTEAEISEGLALALEATGQDGEWFLGELEVHEDPQPVSGSVVFTMIRPRGQRGVDAVTARWYRYERDGRLRWLRARLEVHVVYASLWGPGSRGPVTVASFEVELRGYR